MSTIRSPLERDEGLVPKRMEGSTRSIPLLPNSIDLPRLKQKRTSTGWPWSVSLWMLHPPLCSCPSLTPKGKMFSPVPHGGILAFFHCTPQTPHQAVAMARNSLFLICIMVQLHPAGCTPIHLQQRCQAHNSPFRHIVT